MKKKILVLMILFMGMISHIYAQQTYYKVIEVLKPQTFALSSYNLMNGGKTRTVFPINLPSNTKEWCYTINSFASESNANNSLSMLSKIASSIDPSVGIAVGITNFAISESKSGESFKVVLLDEEGRDAFINKEDVKLFGSGYSYYKNYSHDNYIGGETEITSQDLQSGTYYIGIQNNSSKDLYFTLAVFAKVKKINNNVWNTNNKKSFYEFYYEQQYNASLMDKDYADYMANKICEKIFKNYTPQTWDNTAAEKKNSDVKKYKEDAIQELLGPISENHTRSVTYDKLASKSLSSRDYVKAIEYATKSVEYDKTNISAKETLGLAYTLNGQVPEGLECYIDAIELIKKYKYRYLVNQKMNVLKSNLKQFQKSNPSVDFSELTDLIKSEKMSFFD